MDNGGLVRVLKSIKENKISIEEALQKLKFLPFEDIGFAKIDHHRALRRGFPEVIFCQNKTKGQIVSIINSMVKSGNNILATRADLEIYNSVKKFNGNAQFNKLANTIFIPANIKKTIKEKNIIKSKNKKNESKKILIVTAGTSDISVAEEAAVTAEAAGNEVERLYDVGVAGIHRLLSNAKKLQEANVLIVVAGMEGALPSVVSGLVDKPVIAVPTSVGYGASFKGISPLLTMLNSCSPGIVVVNIDNGFGAGYFASLINK